jgi:hypothetical protein
LKNYFVHELLGERNNFVNNIKRIKTTANNLKIVEDPSSPIKKQITVGVVKNEKLDNMFS